MKMKGFFGLIMEFQLIILDENVEPWLWTRAASGRRFWMGFFCLSVFLPSLLSVSEPVCTREASAVTYKLYLYNNGWAVFAVYLKMCRIVADFKAEANQWSGFMDTTYRLSVLPVSPRRSKAQVSNQCNTMTFSKPSHIYRSTDCKNNSSITVHQSF